MVLQSLPELTALPLALRPDFKQDPSYPLYLLNPLCTFGLEGALDLVHNFAEHIPERREDLKAKLLRLDGILSLESKVTRQAEDMSEKHANPHGQVTAIINNAWARIGEHSDGEALTELSKIDFRDVSSWWQSFQIHFAQGCSSIDDKGALSRSLIALLQAQALMVIKGFRGWVLPDVRSSGRPRNPALYPEHIIDWLIEEHDVSKEHMDELREQAIPLRMLDRLWTPPTFDWAPASTLQKLVSRVGSFPGYHI